MNIYGNPVDGPRIVPYNTARKATDVLPNGHDGFRVTQRFADINPKYPQFGQHGALDVGNYVCGDRVLAMGPGTVDRRFTDAAGALCIRIAHANNETTFYGHLQKQLVVVGQKVTEGQQIGTVGKTGLGAVCHLHFEVRRNGVKVDPWPTLRQNQKQLPDTSVEDDVDPDLYVPVAVCDVASGGTLYGDANRKTVKSASWPGGAGIPIYAKPIATTGSPTPLAILRLSSSGGVNPYKGYIGVDKVSNVRVP